MKNLISKVNLNKVLCVLLSISMCMAFCANAFAENYWSPSVDASLMHTYLAEDEGGNDAIKDIANDFLKNYITDEMSDFEKEMQIIKYLVATVTYDSDEANDDTPFLNDSYKAYGALVNHKAVCSGYAKAFDLLAKYCGLITFIVTGEAINSANQNGAHAWNQICLDGEWYNVDVTWEDPITNIEVGFDKLFNEYINCTDAEFAKNHVRENGFHCTATKYGKDTVAYYLNTGSIDTNANLDSLRKIFEMQIANYFLSNSQSEMQATIDQLLLLGAKYDDDSNFIDAGNDLLMNTYIFTKLASGENIIVTVSPSNSRNTFSIDKGDWIEKNLVNVINSRIRMQRVFLSDGNQDTRILIFKFGE